MKDTVFLLRAQRSEITEHLIYSKLALKTKDQKNRRILKKIAEDELKHYSILREITKQDVEPDRFKVSRYVFASRVLGLSFGLKFMENGESAAQKSYGSALKRHPELKELLQDEERHERELLGMISEERLEYASSIVLGLNDAIVEFTGTLAGLSLAIGDNRIISLTGMIMGIAAALSMSATSYLSAKEDNLINKKPLTSALYTGIAYLLAVSIIVSPFFILHDPLRSVALMLLFSILLIAGYTFYVTTAKGERFMPRFLEMCAISLGVAAVSFGIGFVLKQYLGLGV